MALQVVSGNHGRVAAPQAARDLEPILYKIDIIHVFSLNDKSSFRHGTSPGVATTAVGVLVHDHAFAGRHRHSCHGQRSDGDQGAEEFSSFHHISPSQF
ncbi:hypothetical protein AGR5A_pa30238 [Agrobacterium genomosp. 5 str. CFBP 6626]|nr:hypothetical protein AGR5A_pa30238 [Agrobacterium genomosp. 5 str. CFBP 6626]